MLCDADGGIIDDLIVYRADDGYLIVCNAANHEAVLAQPGRAARGAATSMRPWRIGPSAPP